ncbi:MAG TPA: sigma-70 family RNA polymerase sigma factor [Candidatus Mediterraneibacter colneyensis]|nr:sigma-70 family RNA polymerase sigma factor [Candidatus Mediterraneibacter colneyensis]
MYDYEKGSEQELIRRARRGDVKAFARLYSEIYKDLYRFALCVLRHPQEAEDAVSETVAAAYENISKLKKEGSFRSWMFTILSNQCRKSLAQNRREISSDNAQAYARETCGSEPDYAQQQDVRRAFEELDEEERMIVSFSVFGGYKSDEIAFMLKKNAATVRSRKSRALEKMRVSLGGSER